MKQIVQRRKFPSSRHQRKKKTVNIEQSAPVSQTPVCTKEEAEHQWAACIAQFEQDTPSLAALLRLATLETIAGNVLVVSVPYDFYRDKLTSAAYLPKLQGAISTMLHCPITVQVSVRAPAQAEEHELQTLAAAFGGEVLAP